MTSRLFHDTASWNRTADDLGIDLSPAVADWPTRLALYGGGPDPRSQRWYLQLRNYSVPIYDASTATGVAKCFQKPWAQRQQAFGNTPIGTIIPWNPAWRPGTGSDRILCIVNYRTGEAWYLWVLDPAGFGDFDWFGPNVRAGLLAPFAGDKLSLATLNRQPNIWSARDGSTVPVRGMGIDQAALVLRAAEVATGHVRHALPLTIANPATSPAKHRRPATKLEHPAGVPTGPDGSNVMPASQTLPSGARFRVTRDRAWVEAWARARWGDSTLARTMTTIGWALCEYGAIVAETGGNRVGIQTDSMIDPYAATIWRALGIPDDGSANPGMTLLDGLVDEAHLAVVKEPA